jgi:hypothetical protein
MDTDKQDTTGTPTESPKSTGTLIANPDGSYQFFDGDAPSTPASPDGSQSGAREADDEADDAAATVELAAARTDAEREEIRERRRQERKDRNERRTTARERDRDLMRTLGERLVQQEQVIRTMAGRLAQLDNRSVGADLAKLDDRIATGERFVDDLKGVIADATDKQNGTLVADATDRLTKANADIAALKDLRTRAHRSINARRHAAEEDVDAPPRREAPAPVDRAVKTNFNEWHKAHAWYKPNGTSVDDRIVRAIDDSVEADGFNPSTKEYWEELTARVAERLPARVAPRDPNPSYDSGAQGSERRSPVAGAGREGAAGSGAPPRGGVTLSKERVEALKAAGIWDDPVARADMIRRYKAHDSANR